MPAPTHRDLTTIALLDDPLMLAIPSTWEVRPSATLATYRDEPWIAEPAETPARRALEHAARSADFTPDIRYRVEDFTVTRALVAEGLGVALIPQLASSKSTEGVRLIPIPRQNMVRHIYAATRHDEIQRPTVRAALDALQDAATAIETAH